MTGFIIFLLALTVVVAWHELGHYAACRAFGIPVKTFSVGVGPKLLGFTDRRGTTWKLSPFLIGGYILPNEERMLTASPFQKFVVAAAGPFFNFLLIVIPVLFMGGVAKTLMVIGLLWSAYVETYSVVLGLLLKPFIWLASWFVTFAPASEAAKVVGPIGMAQAASKIDAPDSVFVTFAALAIFFNIALMVFNLLPIPALDGGRMVMAVVEGAIGRGERFKKFENGATVVGGLVLLYIFVVVISSDVIRLFV